MTVAGVKILNRETAEVYSRFEVKVEWLGVLRSAWVVNSVSYDCKLADF